MPAIATRCHDPRVSWTGRGVRWGTEVNRGYSVPGPARNIPDSAVTMNASSQTMSASAGGGPRSDQYKLPPHTIDIVARRFFRNRLVRCPGFLNVSRLVGTCFVRLRLVGLGNLDGRRCREFRRLRRVVDRLCRLRRWRCLGRGQRGPVWFPNPWFVLDGRAGCQPEKAGHNPAHKSVQAGHGQCGGLCRFKTCSLGPGWPELIGVGKVPIRIFVRKEGYPVGGSTRYSALGGSDPGRGCNHTRAQAFLRSWMSAF